MRTRYRFILIAAILVLAGGLGFSQSSNNAKSPYHIAWYFPIPHPFGMGVQLGVQGFEKDTGISVKQLFGHEMGQDAQNQAIEALAAQGYKQFAVYPADPSGANGLYQELVKQNCKIVNFGTSTLQPTPASFAVAADVGAVAAFGTEQLIALMGNKGNIINILESLTDANTIQRKKAIEATVAKHPNVKIIQEIADMSTIEDATEKIENAIAGNMNKVDGIICTGATTTVAMSQILKERAQKGAKKIPFIGADDDPTVVAAIKDGTIQGGTLAQNSYGVGYISCMVLKLLAEGYKPKAGQYFINSDVVYITKDNVSHYKDEQAVVTNRIIKTLKETYFEKK
jgi:ribose transport system substrate-binding protein